MSIKLGIYDFFAYTIPGVFYILVGIFGLAVFGFAGVDLQTVNGLSLVGGILLAGAGYGTGLSLSLGLVLLALVFVAHFLIVNQYLPNLVMAATSAGLSVLAARQGLKFKKWCYSATFKAATAEAMRADDLFEVTPRFLRTEQTTTQALVSANDVKPSTDTRTTRAGVESQNTASTESPSSTT